MDVSGVHKHVTQRFHIVPTLICPFICIYSRSSCPQNPNLIVHLSLVQSYLNKWLGLYSHSSINSTEKLSLGKVEPQVRGLSATKSHLEEAHKWRLCANYTP